MIFLYVEIEPGWLRHTPEYVLKVSLVLSASSNINFGSKNLKILICWKPLSFGVRPKFPFWITHFKIHPVEYVHMDHTDHFGFRYKKAGIWKNVTKKSKIGKSHFLRLSGKWINSSGVSSQKLSYVYEAPAGAFISAKLTFLGISDIPILEKVCISSYLGFPFHLWKWKGKGKWTQSPCWGTTSGIHVCQGSQKYLMNPNLQCRWR